MGIDGNTEVTAGQESFIWQGKRADKNVEL